MKLMPMLMGERAIINKSIHMNKGDALDYLRAFMTKSAKYDQVIILSSHGGITHEGIQIRTSNDSENSVDNHITIDEVQQLWKKHVKNAHPSNQLLIVASCCQTSSTLVRECQFDGCGVGCGRHCDLYCETHCVTRCRVKCNLCSGKCQNPKHCPSPPQGGITTHPIPGVAFLCATQPFSAAYRPGNKEVRKSSRSLERRLSELTVEDDVGERDILSCSENCSHLIRALAECLIIANRFKLTLVDNELVLPVDRYTAQ